MDVRAQIASVFHLDKCLGCHTCSVACKNVWTDRKGAEYMWWNNVETRPGTGYPRGWEDQERWQGGWERRRRARSSSARAGRAAALARIFHNPRCRRSTTTTSRGRTGTATSSTRRRPSDASPPRGRSRSSPASRWIRRPGRTGTTTSPARRSTPRRTPNLGALTPEERGQLFGAERLAFFHLPRTCNHCANPACVAACPSGAIYKRGEDGLVLSTRRSAAGGGCASRACPYKKVFYNWKEREVGEVHRLLPADRVGRGAGVLRGLPGPDPLPGRAPLRRGPDRGARGAPGAGARRGAARARPRSRRPGGGGGGARAPGSRRGARGRAPLADLPLREAVGARAPAPPRVPHAPHGVLRAAAPAAPRHGGARGHAHRRGALRERRARADPARVPRPPLRGGEPAVAAALRKLVALRLWRRAAHGGRRRAGGGRGGLRRGPLRARDAAELHRLTTFATLEQRVVLPPALRGEAFDPGRRPRWGRCRDRRPGRARRPRRPPRLPGRRPRRPRGGVRGAPRPVPTRRRRAARALRGLGAGGRARRPRGGVHRRLRARARLQPLRRRSALRRGPERSHLLAGLAELRRQVGLARARRAARSPRRGAAPRDRGDPGGRPRRPPRRRRSPRRCGRCSPRSTPRPPVGRRGRGRARRGRAAPAPPPDDAEARAPAQVAP